MRIDCPYCGNRDAMEFAYVGDALLLRRPDSSAPDAVARFHEYLHLRPNPAGRHEETWYHSGGCRSWLKVVRDTRNHVVESVSLVAPSASASLDQDPTGSAATGSAAAEAPR